MTKIHLINVLISLPQDFQFLVSNPSRQHVKVYVRDSHLTFSPNIGFCEVGMRPHLSKLLLSFLNFFF